MARTRRGYALKLFPFIGRIGGGDRCGRPRRRSAAFLRGFGHLCYRATFDELLFDDMTARVLRRASYEPDEFREIMTEIAVKGELRCLSD
jgi:hypothetical protein